MTDKRWDRLKTKFGFDPSTDLVDGRLTKLNAALATVDEQLQRLTDHGVDGGQLKADRDALVLKRAAATAKSRDAQYDELDAIKKDARALAAGAEATVDKRLETLSGALLDAQGRVDFAVNGANRFVHPAVAPAIAAPLKTVKEAQTAALALVGQQQVDALNAIDLKPLNDAMVAPRAASSAINQVTDRVAAWEKNLATLPAGKGKDDFAEALDTLKEAKAALDADTDYAALEKTAKDALAASKGVSDWVRPVSELQRIQDDRRGKAADAVAKAKAVRGAAAKQSVSGPLKQLEDKAAEVDRQLSELIDDRVNGTVDDAKEQRGKDAADKGFRDIVAALLKAIVLSRDMNKGVPELLDGLAAMIGKLPDGEAKTVFTGQLATIAAQADKLDKVADVDKARQGYIQLEKAGGVLMDRVCAARGKDGYAEALEARFGCPVDSKSKKPIDYKAAYEAFNLVPQSHVGHESILGVTFTGSDKQGGAFSPSTKVISIDDFAADDTYEYQIGKKKVKANGFSVTLLHEIGHGVDDRYGIMDSAMKTAGAGDWRTHPVEEVKKALHDAALAELGKATDEVKQAAMTAIGMGLGNKDVVKPTGIDLSRSQWKTIERFGKLAKAMNENSEPWFTLDEKAGNVGGRVYTQTGGKWYSYGAAERAGGMVRNYQWRSPAEWFADLYGFAWMQNKPILTGLPAGVAKWLPQ